MNFNHNVSSQVIYVGIDTILSFNYGVIFIMKDINFVQLKLLQISQKAYFASWVEST